MTCTAQKSLVALSTRWVILVLVMLAVSFLSGCSAQLSSTGGQSLYGAVTGFCGYREFRFDSLATADLVYSYVDSVDYGGPYYISYYFRPCGNITAPDCAAIEGGSTYPTLCQYTVGGSAVNLGYYTPSNAYWSIPAEGVVQMLLHDGALCAGQPRTTIVQYVCNSAVIGYPANFTLDEYPTCTYNLFIETSFACGAEPDSYSANLTQPSTARCNYAGFNLSSLATRDLVATVVDNSYGGPYYENYYYRPCGIVQNAECAVPLANLVPSVCQYTVGGAAVDLAVYRPDLEVWSTLPNGIQSRVQDGTACSNGVVRTVVVQWLCNATANTPLNFTITENPACTYTLQIQTSLVCNTTTAAGPSTGAFSSSSASSTTTAANATTSASTASALSVSSSGSASPSSSSSSSSSTSTAATSSGSATSSSSSGLSSTNKVVVGVVVGVGAPVLIALLVLCCMCRKRGFKKGFDHGDHGDADEDSSHTRSTRTHNDVEMASPQTRPADGEDRQ